MQQHIKVHVIAALNSMTYEKLFDLLGDRLEQIEHGRHCLVHGSEPVFEYNGSPVPAAIVSLLPDYQINPWVIEMIADDILAQHIGHIAAAFMLDLSIDEDEQDTEAYKDGLFICTYNEHLREKLVHFMCGLPAYKHYKEHHDAFMADTFRKWAIAGVEIIHAEFEAESTTKH